MPINTPLLWVIYHPVARIDIVYLCTKFDDFRFSRSSDMFGAPHDLTTPSKTVRGQVMRPIKTFSGSNHITGTAERKVAKFCAHLSYINTGNRMT